MPQRKSSKSIAGRRLSTTDRPGANLLGDEKTGGRDRALAGDHISKARLDCRRGRAQKTIPRPQNPPPYSPPSPHSLRGRDERSVWGDRMIGGSPSILRQEDDPGPNSLPGQGPRAQRWHELSHGRSSPKSLRSHGAKLASPTTSSPDDRHRSDLRPMPHFELCGRPNRSGGPI